MDTVSWPTGGWVVRSEIAPDVCRPRVPESAGHYEGKRLVVRVEQQQEGPALDRIAVAVVGGDLLAVEEHSERVRVVMLPVAVAQLLAVAAEPDDVGQPGADGLVADAETVDDSRRSADPAGATRLR